jgi:hypothetical protein
MEILNNLDKKCQICRATIEPLIRSRQCKATPPPSPTTGKRKKKRDVDLDLDLD